MKTNEFDNVLGIQLVSEDRNQSRRRVVGIAPNWETAQAYACAYFECDEVVKVGSMGAATYGETAYLVPRDECEMSEGDCGYLRVRDWSNCNRLATDRAWVIVPVDSVKPLPEMDGSKRESDGVYGVGPLVGPKGRKLSRFKITRSKGWRGVVEWSAQDRLTGKAVGMYDSSTFATLRSAKDECRRVLYHEAKQEALSGAWLPAKATRAW
ncbi:MAG TPA: hypothetical protein VM537_34450 [Anaerolineae bacterium]|nr:hypothetical protein [Anaerolineae bacterium]